MSPADSNTIARPGGRHSDEMASGAVQHTRPRPEWPINTLDPQSVEQGPTPEFARQAALYRLENPESTTTMYSAFDPVKAYAAAQAEAEAEREATKARTAKRPPQDPLPKARQHKKTRNDDISYSPLGSVEANRPRFRGRRASTGLFDFAAKAEPGFRSAKEVQAQTESDEPVFGVFKESDRILLIDRVDTIEKGHNDLANKLNALTFTNQRLDRIEAILQQPPRSSGALDTGPAQPNATPQPTVAAVQPTFTAPHLQTELIFFKGGSEKYVRLLELRPEDLGTASETVDKAIRKLIYEGVLDFGKTWEGEIMLWRQVDKMGSKANVVQKQAGGGWIKATADSVRELFRRMDMGNTAISNHYRLRPDTRKPLMRIVVYGEEEFDQAKSWMNGDGRQDLQI
jgi:hypothetical protein